MHVWWNNISYVKIWNHPIETTFYKWLFRVPGSTTENFWWLNLPKAESPNHQEPTRPPRRNTRCAIGSINSHDFNKKEGMGNSKLINPNFVGGPFIGPHEIRIPVIFQVGVFLPSHPPKFPRPWHFGGKGPTATSPAGWLVTDEMVVSAK